jgi:flagellar basal-body rod modification protein FlgD
METTAISALQTYGTTERKPSPTLDKDGFLKLMMAQLTHQDPSNPQDSGEMLSQMSQLTMAEQMTNLTRTMTEQTREAKATRAEALLGRTVSYKGDGETPVTGVVEKVDLSGDPPTLTIGGVSGIATASLTEVR